MRLIKTWQGHDIHSTMAWPTMMPSHAPPTAKERSEWFRTTPLHQVPREDAVDENTEIQWTMEDIASTFTSEYTRGSGWTTANPGEHPTVEDSVDEDKVEPPAIEDGSMTEQLSIVLLKQFEKVAQQNSDIVTQLFFKDRGEFASQGKAQVDDDARRFLYTVQYKRKADKITQEPLTHMRWCSEVCPTQVITILEEGTTVEPATPKKVASPPSLAITLMTPPVACRDADTTPKKTICPDALTPAGSFRVKPNAVDVVSAIRDRDVERTDTRKAVAKAAANAAKADKADDAAKADKEKRITAAKKQTTKIAAAPSDKRERSSPPKPPRDEEEPPAKAARGPRFMKRPAVNEERSIDQFLGRTGYRGKGETISFSWKKGRQYSCREDAETASAAWLVEELQRQGLS